MPYGLWRNSIPLILTGVGILALAETSCAAPSAGVKAIRDNGAAMEATSSADTELQIRVQDAFRSDPYFYDAHVSVLAQHGIVVLKGFVLSDWDLLDAIRIATKAAKGARVVDELTIEVGGRH